MGTAFARRDGGLPAPVVCPCDGNRHRPAAANGKTLRLHARGILSWWEHRLSSGKMEGVTTRSKSKPSPAKPMAIGTKPSSSSNSSPCTMPGSNLSDEPNFLASRGSIPPKNHGARQHPAARSGHAERSRPLPPALEHPFTSSASRSSLQSGSGPRPNPSHPPQPA